MFSQSNSPELKKKKVEKSFTRVGVSIWNSIPHRLKFLTHLNFEKKVNSILLDVLHNEDNFFNVTCLIEYFMKLT